MFILRRLSIFNHVRLHVQGTLTIVWAQKRNRTTFLNGLIKKFQVFRGTRQNILYHTVFTEPVWYSDIKHVIICSQNKSRTLPYIRKGSILSLSKMHQFTSPYHSPQKVLPMKRATYENKVSPVE